MLQNLRGRRAQRIFGCKIFHEAVQAGNRNVPHRMEQQAPEHHITSPLYNTILLKQLNI